MEHIRYSLFPCRASENHSYIFVIYIKVIQKPKKRPTVKFRDVDRDIMAAVSRSGTSASDTLPTSDGEEHAVNENSAIVGDSDSDPDLDSDSGSEERVRMQRLP